MTQVVGAYVWLEAVRGAGQRLAHHTSVVHQDVNGFHRVREPSHAGQVGQIQMTDLDVACQLGSGLLGLGDGPAGNHHAVTGGGQRPSGGFTDAAVAPGDDDAHGVFVPPARTHLSVDLSVLPGSEMEVNMCVRDRDRRFGDFHSHFCAQT